MLMLMASPRLYSAVVFDAPWVERNERFPIVYFPIKLPDVNFEEESNEMLKREYDFRRSRGNFYHRFLESCKNPCFNWATSCFREKIPQTFRNDFNSVDVGVEHDFLRSQNLPIDIQNVLFYNSPYVNLSNPCEVLEALENLARDRAKENKSEESLELFLILSSIYNSCISYMDFMHLFHL